VQFIFEFYAEMEQQGFCCLYLNVDESLAFGIGKQGTIVWTGVKISFLCKLLCFYSLFWSYYACCLEPFYALIF
jgi:hypothetical protein